MAKKNIFRKIAQRAGIKGPIIEYIRSQNAYAVCITVASPTGTGYIDASVGVYENPSEAEAKLKDDLLNFLEKYPEAWESVTFKYNTVTKEPKRSPKQTAHDLLEMLITGQAGEFDEDELKQMAQTSLSYLKKLEAHRPKEKASGRYQSRVPEQEKKAIEWDQPSVRNQPVYQFEITCPYCGRRVKLERFSPREPQHCERESCTSSHIKELNKQRQQRWRDRQKLK